MRRPVLAPRFTVAGQLEGRPVHAVWSAGAWRAGDRELLGRLAAVPLEPVPITTTGPAWVPDSRTPRGAVAAALAVLDATPRLRVTGPGVPAWPAVPEGAIP